MPWPLVLVVAVVVGLKVMSNWCSSWNPLGCTRLGKENGPSSAVKVAKQDIPLLVSSGIPVLELGGVSAVLLLAPLQLRTMAKRSQSSRPILREKKRGTWFLGVYG